MARIPIYFPSDREALDFALGSPEPKEQRIVWIRNTLDLARLAISEALAREARTLSGWQLSPQVCEVEFNTEDNSTSGPQAPSGVAWCSSWTLRAPRRPAQLHSWGGRRGSPRRSDPGHRGRPVWHHCSGRRIQRVPRVAWCSIELIRCNSGYDYDVLYSFSGGADGVPPAGLILDAAGNL